MADCRTTVDFLKEFNRMCDTFDCDDNCPFLCFNSGKYETCEDFVKKFTDEAVQILQKWSDSHPAPKPKTYADVFFEKFPNCSCSGIVNVESGFKYPVYCREILFGQRNGGCHNRSENYHCSDCWNEPYKEGEEYG